MAWKKPQIKIIHYKMESCIRMNDYDNPPCFPTWSYNRELNQLRQRRRWWKRHFEREFALFETWTLIFHLVQFVKINTSEFSWIRAGQGQDARIGATTIQSDTVALVPKIEPNPSLPSSGREKERRFRRSRNQNKIWQLKDILTLGLSPFVI